MCVFEKERSFLITLFVTFGLTSIAFSNKVQNASVTYNIKTGKFALHDFISPDAVAFANFQDEIFLTGWSYLEVKTNEQFPDPVQAYAAGLLEGYLTSDLISKHWYNSVSDYCEDDKAYCQELFSFLQQNLDFLNDNIKKKRIHDEYWHQIALTLEQYKGLEDGYRNNISEPSTDIDIMGLFLINIMGDLLDLEKVLDKKHKTQFGSGLCSSLIKILPGSKNLYFAHDTWYLYNRMLRILKKYSLMFHTSMKKGSPVVPGHTWTFSSQPAMIYSVDDFYLISNGLAAMETSLINNNASLWQYVKPKGIILEWQRNIIANRLADSGDRWTKIFGIMNSGTYNNQWMILDYKKFKPERPLQDGLLWVLEQMPGHLHFEDKTDVLRRQNYWPSYNVAYYKDIFNLSDGVEQVKKYGDHFSYEKAPRALIFKRDQGKVTDIESMIKVMRYNDYTNDPFSRCNCTPPYSADNAISARNDLNPVDGKYPFPDLGHGANGAIDMKLTSYELFQQLEFVAIGGPTYDPLPPFQWSKSDFNKTVKHKGHPDLWKFNPIIHKWNL